MIIAWCFYYLFASFQDPLPYASCPVVNNLTVTECELAGRTQYYWYKSALDVSLSIEESGGLLWHLCLVLLLAWIIVFICTMRGVQSAGKVFMPPWMVKSCFQDTLGARDSLLPAGLGRGTLGARWAFSHLGSLGRGKLGVRWDVSCLCPLSPGPLARAANSKEPLATSKSSEISPFIEWIW